MMIRTLRDDILYTLRYVSVVILGLLGLGDLTFLLPFRLPSRAGVDAVYQGDRGTQKG